MNIVPETREQRICSRGILLSTAQHVVFSYDICKQSVLVGVIGNNATWTHFCNQTSGDL